MELNDTNASNQTVHIRQPEHTGTILLIVYTCVIIFVGGVGNGVLVFAHLKRRPDPRASQKIKVLYHFIFVMAILDFLACALVLPTHVFFLVTQCRHFSSLSCKMFAFGRLFTVFSSVFVLVAIAIDRYVSVCFPFVQAVAINLSRAHMMTAVALGAGAVMATPNLIVFEVFQVEPNAPPVCQPMENSEFKSEVTKGLLYMTLSTYIGSAVVIMFLYMNVFIFVFKQAIKRRNLRNRSGIQPGNTLGNRMEAIRDRSTAKTGMMLFLATAVFVLAWTPYWIMFMLLYNWPESISVLNNLHLINLVGSSYYISNAVNPVIYTFANKNFRDEVLGIVLNRNSDAARFEVEDDRNELNVVNNESSKPVKRSSKAKTLDSGC